MNTHLSECPDEEQKMLSRQAKTAKRLLVDQDHYEVETIRYSAGSRFAQKAEPGDLAVQVHKEQRATRVYPPARVLKVLPYRLGDSECLAVHLERRKSDKGWPLTGFKKAAQSVGIKITPYTERTVPASAKQRLLQFFKR